MVPKNQVIIRDGTVFPINHFDRIIGINSADKAHDATLLSCQYPAVTPPIVIEVTPLGVGSGVLEVGASSANMGTALRSSAMISSTTIQPLFLERLANRLINFDSFHKS